MPKSKVEEKKTSKKTTAAKKETKPKKSEAVVAKKAEPAPAKKAAAKKVTKKTAQKGEDGAPKKRSFKAIYVNPQGDVVMEGRYCGAKPKQAGCKALTGICKLFTKSKKKFSGEIHFGVKETTRGGKGKTYYYSGERVILDKPITLQIGGGKDAKKIVYKYNNSVKKASEADCTHLKNPVETKDAEEAQPVKVEKKKTTKK
jgi:hypothetical protein